MLEMLKLKENPMSALFLAASAAVFLVARAADPENIRFLAFDFQALPERWHAILTYGFVHVDWNHIIVNMGILIWVGIWVERLLGSGRYLLLVVCGILAGGITLLVRETAGIGFSAAAAAILSYYHFAFPWKRELPFNVPNIVVPVVVFIVSVGAVLFGWLPAVGHYPHLAGALVGVAFLAVFRKHHRPLPEE